MVSKMEIFENLSVDSELSGDVNFIDLSKGSNMVVSVTIILVCLTCLGVLFTWMTNLTINKSICCTLLTSCLFLSLFISFMVLGFALVIPGTLGDQFIQENCQHVQDKKMDQISPFYRGLFEQVNLIDTKLDEAVN